MPKDKEILEKYREKDPWGLLVSVDLKGCDPKLIRDKKAITEFVDRLCELIEMRRFGKTVVVDFGEDPKVSGFSMTQLIETSLVSGHFANQTNSAYLDIFSCKAFPPKKAANFAKEFFGAKRVRVKVAFRY